MAGAQDKTEKPIGKKLNEARRKGNVPKSRDLAAVVTCLGGAIATYMCAAGICQHAHQMMIDLWGDGFKSGLEDNLNRLLFLEVANHFFFMVAPILGSVIVLAVAINFGQIRGLLAWEAIMPSMSKLNPINGLKHLISGRSLVELAKTLLKLTFLTYVVYYFVQRDSDLFFPLMDMELTDITKVIGSLALKIVVRASLIMLVLAILDFAYQRRKHNKDLMMTKQEVKEEHKQTEGSPLIKSKIRSAQRALARRRMMSKVPKADIVLTNPTHYAVALEYSKDMEAPKVLAKGKDLVAHKITRIARQHNIPVIPNPPLARALYHEVELEGTIPVTLYRAVAKVLAYVYQQRQQHR